MRIVFCIRNLALAGAEKQLVMLANGLARRGHHVSVIVLYSGGVLEKSLEGVTVVYLNKKTRWDFTFLPRLIGYLRRTRPDVIHGYLGLGNILSVLCKPFLKGAIVVWGVRASYVDLSRYDLGARLSFHAERFLSRFAAHSIANSLAGREYAVSIGYPAKAMSVIFNGIDVAKYNPGLRSAYSLRETLGVSPDEILFGLIGRIDIMKGHDLFLHAASQVASRFPQVRFVCVGHGDGEYAREMKELGKSLPGLKGKLYWLPSQEDLAPVYEAIDVLVSASRFGEGFPNVVGEAMASGVPCLVSDVGDSKMIVGDTGFVVKPEEPEALSNGMEIMVDRLVTDGELGARVRLRIEKMFSPDMMISSTESLLQKMCDAQELS